MLWVSTPTHIRVFNAFAPPRKDSLATHDPEIELFSDVASNLEKLQGLLFTRDFLASGEFWAGPLGKQIDRATRIDEQLVSDLTLAVSKLTERGMESLAAHRLLLRTIFIAYLEAKAILPKSLFEGLRADRFESVLADAEATRTFFSRMRETFNGDLFRPPPKDDGSSVIEGTLTDAQLEIPRCILARTELTTFQQSLNFWRYDFGVIPIELISSIYEQFIHAADPERATQAGTHYTPVNLVDLVLSQVFDDKLFGGNKLPHDAKVLDLSCGSGVFLVESLRKLVARRIASGEEHTRELVRETLYEQVFGVDVEETAVEIAAFSLCLTAFELDPEPNSTRPLRFERELIGQNLFVEDAFEAEAGFAKTSAFKDKRFSVIVGNPPWTRHKGPRSDQPSSNPSHVAYCDSRTPKVTLPFRNPPDQAFVYRASDFSRPDARFGFILEGKRFFSHHPQSLKAKRELFESFAPRILFNLSALHRENLFPSAEQPALVVVFANSPATEKDSFLYVTVERDLTYREHGVLRVGPENIHRISVKLAAKSQNALKVAAWGTARDMALVERLRETYPSLKQYLAANGLEMSNGYKDGKRKKPVPVEFHGLPWLTGGRLLPFHLDVSALPPFLVESLERVRSRDIYRGPLLLAGSGLHGNRIVAAACDDDVVYSMSYCGIPMGKTDPDMTYYLNGILNSSVATYFVFLTATKWGIEKYEILANDYLCIPVPEMSKADQHVVDRLLKAEAKLRQRGGEQHTPSSVAELDDAVFDLYKLEPWERVLVEDMLDLTIDYQRKHGKSKALGTPDMAYRKQYAESLMGIIQPLLTTSRRQSLAAEVYDVEGPLRVVRFQFVRGNNSEPKVSLVAREELSAILGRIAASVDNEMSKQLYTRRHLRLYAENTFYIVKPAQRRFWSRSAAMADADSVLKDLIGMDRG
jgi:SAM-dependent methyltransferase